MGHRLATIVPDVNRITTPPDRRPPLRTVVLGEAAPGSCRAGGGTVYKLLGVLLVLAGGVVATAVAATRVPWIWIEPVDAPWRRPSPDGATDRWMA
jgi:hypothetical protein